jgi:hypothetical protein
MIIVSLFGGLGNQMFQFACAKAIAKKINVGLKLDISLVNDRTPRNNFTFRNYELGVFKIKEEIATKEEVRQFVPNLWNSKEYIKQLYKLRRFFNGKKLYREKLKFIYDKDIELVKDNTYIYGYFQTEKYFENLRTDLLQDFSLKRPINKINNALIIQIKRENAVSIHIRRGDYINSPFELLDFQEYYMKAIEFIQLRVESPTFYIFTNDYLWAEENFSSMDIKKTIVKINNFEQSYFDMILMSKCMHNICANSSFSWWGAWLNINPDKIVITPKKWFKDSEYIDSTSDLIPSDWITI